MKFKVGDIIRPKGSDLTYKVIKIVLSDYHITTVISEVKPFAIPIDIIDDTCVKLTKLDKALK